MNIPDLTDFYCSNNMLTSVPNYIINFRRLEFFIYYNNQIEYIPAHITRFLNRLKNKDNNLKLYNDGQNVHNHMIQESIRDSIYRIIQNKSTISYDVMIKEILDCDILTHITKEILMEYIKIEDIHSVLNITFAELLLNIWDIIRIHKDKNEILKIINIEMNDSICKCFTGRMSRLINCLNGFDSRVDIKMADNEQIGNIIYIIKEKLAGNYTIEEHKRLVAEEMKERGYDEETIDEWIIYIE
jgi:hypothetical protein